MQIYVPISQIDDNPFQARQDYDDVADLAARIAAALNSYPDSYGLMQIPRGRLIVDQTDTVVSADDIALFSKVDTLDSDLDSGLFRVQLAFGHRRLRAFRYLVETAAPGYENGRFPIHIDALTDEQMLDAVWSENRERKDISAVEEAELLARKLERAKSQREVADAWGLDRSTVANRLRLLELPAEIQQANRDGRLSERACLALAPIVEVQTAVNGKVKWGEWHSSYGPPIAPAAFIEKAINDPKMTSDNIRDYAKRALDHAGKDLPTVIAQWPAPEARGILNTTCKGCPKRINNTCLSEACLTAKQEGFQEYIIAEAADVLAVPFSDREEDFEFEYKQRSALKALWESGQQRDGTNFVFGWQVGQGFRPFSRNVPSEWINSSELWDDDGRKAIVIGHRGSLPVHMLGSDGEEKPGEDIPSHEVLQGWRNEAQQMTAAAIKQAKTAVADAFYFKLQDAADMLQAFISKADAEWIDEYEKFLKKFTEFMWDKSPSAPWYDSVENYDRTVAFVKRVGLDAAVTLSTGSKLGDRRRQAIFALTLWYENRDHSWKWPEKDTGGTAEALKRPLQQALDGLPNVSGIPNDEGSELIDLRYELARALRDVDKQVAEWEAEETAARANLAGDEDADLYDDEEE